MTIDRALRLWFLALYAFGMVGFLSNVLRIRRGRPAFEQQIGPLPEVGALVAWFFPPIILLSGVGKMPIDQPILGVLGVGLSLYSQIMVVWTVRTLGRPPGSTTTRKTRLRVRARADRDVSLRAGLGPGSVRAMARRGTPQQ